MSNDNIKVTYVGDAESLARASKRASASMDDVSKHAQMASVAIGTGLGVVAGRAISDLAGKTMAWARDSADAYKNAAAQAWKLSRVTGQSAEDASRLAFAAKETGVDFDTLTRLTGRLEKNIMSADKATKLHTTSQRLQAVYTPKLIAGHIEMAKHMKVVTSHATVAGATLHALGFAVKDATGHILPMSVLMPKIADKFATMPAGVEKTALALKLFGKEGLAMLPLMNQGSAGLAKFAEEADKLGITMSGKDVEAYKTYIAAQRQFHASIEGVKISLGRELFPLFSQWATTLANNGPEVAAYARTMGEKLVPFVHKAGVEFASLVQGFKDGTGTGGQIRKVLGEIGDVAKTTGQILQSTVLPVVKWFANHPAAFKGVAEGMATFWVATKLAFVWNSRLAPALAASAAGEAAIAAESGAAAAGITAVGGAATLALPEVAALAAAAFAAYKGFNYVKGMAQDAKPNYINSSGYSDYTAQNDPNSDMYAHPIGLDGKPIRPTVAPGKPNVPDDYAQKSGRGKRYVKAAKSVPSLSGPKSGGASGGAGPVGGPSLTDVAHGMNNDLAIAAMKQNQALAAAAKKRQQVADALKAATQKIADALNTRTTASASVRDSLVSSNTVLQAGISWTAKDLLAAFGQKMAKVKRFAGLLSTMTHKGYAPSIIGEVAAAGVDGGFATAQGLASASSSQVKQFNATQHGIDAAAGFAGDRTAKGVYGLAPMPNQTIQLTVDGKVLAETVNRWNARANGRGVAA